MKGEAGLRNSWNLWHVAILIYICVIYGNSLTPAVVSSQESGFLLARIQVTFETWGLESMWLTEHIIRKTAHFVEYAGLGFLLVQGFKAWIRPMGRRFRTVLELSFIIPFVDETIQLFVSGRSGQVSDVWLDMCGAAFGLAVTMVLMTWLSERRWQK